LLNLKHVHDITNRAYRRGFSFVELVAVSCSAATNCIGA
jgi:hypothetical protein